MNEALELLRKPDDGRGVHVDVGDPSIGPNFRLRIQIRFAEGDEREKKGPSTQLIIRGDLMNFPAPLSKAITENCETDLFQKEWLKDCKRFAGKPGRPARLYSSLMHVQLSPSLLPIKIEDVVLREFALCPGEGALPERGPGLVVLEHRPPENVSEFEGMPIPAKSKGMVRVKGGMSAFYKSQSQDPNCMNVLAVSKLGLPVLQAILPLSLLKRFAVDLFLNSIKLTDRGLYQNWDKLDYKNRAATMNTDFYRAVSELPMDKLTGT
jgi:hypothetical protein